MLELDFKANYLRQPWVTINASLCRPYAEMFHSFQALKSSAFVYVLISCLQTLPFVSVSSHDRQGQMQALSACPETRLCPWEALQANSPSLIWKHTLVGEGGNGEDFVTNSYFLSGQK